LLLHILRTLFELGIVKFFIAVAGTKRKPPYYDTHKKYDKRVKQQFLTLTPNMGTINIPTLHTKERVRPYVKTNCSEDAATHKTKHEQESSRKAQW
jgi:hypothetical protein